MDRQQPPPIVVRIQRVVAPAIAAVAGLALLIASSFDRAPRLVWNISPSVAIGLYAISMEPVRRGDIALVRLPARIAKVAQQRRYLSRSMELLKPVAAVAGDRVCRLGGQVFIRGAPVVAAHRADAMGRPLPSWQGCRTLSHNELFLLAKAPDSFDSRYFGAVDTDHIIGHARPFWVVPDRQQ